MEHAWYEHLLFNYVHKRGYKKAKHNVEYYFYLQVSIETRTELTHK